MGLDMYLSARKYINKIDWKLVDVNVDLPYSAATTAQYRDVVSAAGLDHVQKDNDVYGANVSVNAAYWRKSNQIHKWFVDNVQKGEDDCGEYYVSHEKLRELLTTCRQALFHKNPQLLPPQSGFFFGNTDIDEWYWNDIKDTIKQLSKLTDLHDFEDLSFYYQSSW